MKGNPTPVDTFHSNSDETEFTINTRQDVEPILEENKQAYNNYGDLLPPGKSGKVYVLLLFPRIYGLNG